MYLTADLNIHWIIPLEKFQKTPTGQAQLESSSQHILGLVDTDWQKLPFFYFTCQLK